MNFSVTKLLFTPVERSSFQTRFWFCLSLAFAALYGTFALRQAFSGEFVLQDDTRQHVFWMQRFVEPGAFPNDLIANYYQSLAPMGYAALYRVMAAIGIHPFLLSKLLPPVLGLITTGYCFGVAVELLPIPLTGFITSLLLNQSIWLRDDLASATPRAFLYPLFFAFLYYLLRRHQGRSLWRSLVPYLLSLLLLALFFPIYVLVAAGVIALIPIHWQNGRLWWIATRRDYWFCLAGLGVCFLGVLQYLVTSSGDFGPVTRLSQAKEMAEFLPGGQYVFFRNGDLLKFWLFGRGSGFFPRSLFTPVTLISGLFLPVLLRFPVQFPLTRLIREIDLLPKLLVVCTGLFLTAHALLFQLYFPSRYTGHILPIVISLATGIVITLILEALYRQVYYSGRFAAKSLLAVGAMLVLAVSLVFYPAFVSHFPSAGYIYGPQPALYQFFAQQPENSLIASLSEEASNIPSFSHRSVLIAREYAVPFHLGYYHQIRKRLSDLIRAQYSPDITVVRQFIQQYGVTFWLLDKDAFSPEYLTGNKWRRQYQPEVTEAVASLQQGAIPRLQQLIEHCTVFQTESAVVLQATCLMNTPSIEKG